jgi:hypothetical protein
MSAKDVLTAIGVSAAEHVSEASLESFLLRLVDQKEWFTSAQRENAKRFDELKRLLRSELISLKMIRVGKVRVTIYLLGIDNDGRVAGVKMNAIET